MLNRFCLVFFFKTIQTRRNHNGLYKKNCIAKKKNTFSEIKETKTAIMD
jgi:hypothetical protein